MPIYEYLCEECGDKFDMLVRSQNDIPTCNCGSRNLKKLFSAFAVSEKSTVCQSGSCAERVQNGMTPPPCASGMCGL